MSDETIAAIATPLGEGGLAVIRISGPKTFEIADACFKPVGRSSLKPSAAPTHTIQFGKIVRGNRIVDEVLLAVLRARFVPNRIVLLVDSPETSRKLAKWIPSVEGMPPLNGRAAVYVCRDYTCQLPVSEAAQFSELLQY